MNAQEILNAVANSRGSPLRFVEDAIDQAIGQLAPSVRSLLRSHFNGMSDSDLRNVLEFLHMAAGSYNWEKYIPAHLRKFYRAFKELVDGGGVRDIYAAYKGAFHDNYMRLSRLVRMQCHPPGYKLANGLVKPRRPKPPYGYKPPIAVAAEIAEKEPEYVEVGGNDQKEDAPVRAPIRKGKRRYESLIPYEDPIPWSPVDSPTRSQTWWETIIMGPARWNGKYG